MLTLFPSPKREKSHDTELTELFNSNITCMGFWGFGVLGGPECMETEEGKEGLDESGGKVGAYEGGAYF